MQGIEGVTSEMVEDAKAQGKRWKLVSKLLMKEGGEIESVEVKPMMLDMKADSLSNVRGNRDNSKL
jgi:homoserine dehydrogenase